MNNIDTGTGQVIFVKGVWYIDGEVNNGLYNVFDMGYNIEVIGNKFDNRDSKERMRKNESDT